MFAPILASCRPSSPQNVWNQHHDMFITDIRDCFRGIRDLFPNDTDVLAYALLEVRNYLSDMVTALFTAFGLPTVHENGAPLTTKSQQKYDLQILRDKVHNSISSSNAAQRKVFIEMIGAIMPGVLSSKAFYPIPPATASPNPSIPLIHQTSTSLPHFNRIPFRSLSPFCLYSL